MPQFRVTWEIDIEAETPVVAAEQALRIQRKPDSWATVFEVYEGKELAAHVDLSEPEESEFFGDWANTED